MMRTFRLLSSLLLVCFTLQGFAQSADEEDPWIERWVDSSSVAYKQRFVPTAVRVSVDAFAPIRSALDEDHSGYEFGLDVDVNKFFLHYTGGYSKQRYDETGILYRNQGSYSRIGLGYNLLNTNRALNAIIFGLHRGSGSFDEALFSAEVDTLWGGRSVDRFNTGLRASWMEISMGLRVRIKGQFYMGYDFRIAFAGRVKGGDRAFAPFEVPGYGRAGKSGNLSFQYNFMYRIPFRKKYIPPKKF